MKKILLVVTLAIAGCTPVQQTSQTVGNLVVGPKSMSEMPPFPSAQPTGVVQGRSIQNVMVDIVSPPEADYSTEDNPLIGLKTRIHELFKAEGYSVYITNGTFANTPENMFNVLASDTAQGRRLLNTATVPDVILRLDWREDRRRNALHSVSAAVLGTNTALQVRACLWGPNGKLVWMGDISRPISRASFITGGSVRNQFGQPARNAGKAAAEDVFKAVKPLVPAPPL